MRRVEAAVGPRGVAPTLTVEVTGGATGSCPAGLAGSNGKANIDDTDAMFCVLLRRRADEPASIG